MQVFDNAINNGYPIAWGSDVSEQGFTRDGVAVMPDTEKVQELSGSDRKSTRLNSSHSRASRMPSSA